MAMNSPEQVRLACLRIVQKGSSPSYSTGQRGRIIGELNKACKQVDPSGADITDLNRRLVQGFLLRPASDTELELSSKGLPDVSMYALARWIWGPDQGSPEPRPEFRTEAGWVLDRVNKAALLLSVSKFRIDELILATGQDVLSVPVEPESRVAEAVALGGAVTRSVETAPRNDDFVYPSW